MKIKQKILDWLFCNMSFPKKCESGNELDWILKDNCPCCISNPIENLSNRDYHIKYPAKNRIELGSVAIYLCDVHLEELKDAMSDKDR